MQKVHPFQTTSILIILIRMIVRHMEPRREILMEDRLMTFQDRTDVKHSILECYQVPRLHHRIIVPDIFDISIWEDLTPDSRHNLKMLYQHVKSFYDEFFPYRSINLTIKQPERIIIVQNWSLLSKLPDVLHHQQEILLILLSTLITPLTL